MQDDDITISSEEENEDPKFLVKKLRERAKIAEEKAQEYLTGWQKERADLVNSRKRDEEDKKNFVKFANKNLISDLLPVLDNFDVALLHAEGETRKGIEQIRNQLINTLEKNGLKKFSPIDETFDPALAQAVTMVDVEEKSRDHKVVEVLQPGYILSDRLIRPAMVKVGKYPQKN